MIRLQLLLLSTRLVLRILRKLQTVDRTIGLLPGDTVTVNVQVKIIDGPTGPRLVLTEVT